MGASIVLFGRGRHADDAPDAPSPPTARISIASRFRASIGLGAPEPAIDLDARGIHDHIAHAPTRHLSMQPEAVPACLVAATTATSADNP
jgi:hypothetical protein